MRALLDTHALLWWVEDSSRLSDRARTVLAGRDNRLLWSVASTWELILKTMSGRLRFREGPSRYLASHLAEERIEVLPIHQAHALAVGELPPHHRDPFDRMLVAQAIAEGVPILSADRALSDYPVERIW